MPRLTTIDRSVISNDLREKLEYLHYQVKWPLPMEGKSLEDITSIMEDVTADPDIGEVIRLAKKFRFESRETHMRLYLPKLEGADLDEVAYGIKRRDYNNQVNRDWIIINNLPTHRWPNRHIQICASLDHSKTLELIQWWCAHKRLDTIIYKANAFIEESVERVNTAGQWLRLWPGIESYLPSNLVSMAKQQQRRSQLPPDVDVVEFRQTAAKVEELLAKALILKAMFEGKEQEAVIR